MAALLSETAMATGLAPAHQPEPSDGTSCSDNDLLHILRRRRGQERVDTLTAFFGRIASRAPASARYQQVASMTMSSLSNTYGHMEHFCRTSCDLTPPSLHDLLVASGLFSVLADLLLKPLPEEGSVMDPSPGVQEDALWPTVDYHVLCVVVYCCEVEANADEGLPRAKTRFLPQCSPREAEAAARRACVSLLDLGLLPKLVRLASGERTYLETARACYALRVMSASSPEVCAALAAEAGALGRVCSVAMPGWSARLWEETEVAGLPAYHAPILASGGIYASQTGRSFLQMAGSEGLRRAQERCTGIQEHSCQVLAHVAKDGGRAACMALMDSLLGTEDQDGLLEHVCREMMLPLAHEGSHVGCQTNPEFSHIAALQMLSGLAVQRDLALQLLEQPFNLGNVIGLNLAIPAWWPLDDWLALLKTLLSHGGDVATALLLEPQLVRNLPQLVRYIGLHPTYSPAAVAALKHLVKFLLTEPGDCANGDAALALPAEARARVMLALHDAGLCAPVLEWAIETFASAAVEGHRESTLVMRWREAATDDAQDLLILLVGGADGVGSTGAGGGEAQRQRAIVTATFRSNTAECASLDTLDRNGSEDEAAAMRSKERGNTLVREGKHEAAQVFYGEALSKLPFHSDLRATVLANRAACHLKLQKWAAAIADASHAIAWLMNVEEEEDAALHGLYIKCCFRRATALFEMSQELPDPVASYHYLDGEVFYLYRLAITDMQACMYHDETSAAFRALQARLDGFAKALMEAEEGSSGGED